MARGWCAVMRVAAVSVRPTCCAAPTRLAAHPPVGRSVGLVGRSVDCSTRRSCRRVRRRRAVQRQLAGVSGRRAPEQQHRLSRRAPTAGCAHPPRAQRVRQLSAAAQPGTRASCDVEERVRRRRLSRRRRRSWRSTSLATRERRRQRRREADSWAATGDVSSREGISAQQARCRAARPSARRTRARARHADQPRIDRPDTRRRRRTAARRTRRHRQRRPPPPLPPPLTRRQRG